MPPILTEVTDRIATLTFNRPEKLNALSPDLVEQSIACLQDWGRNPAVGVIVVTGAGRAFCAGGDVSAMAGQSDLTYEQRVDRLRGAQEISRLLYEVPKITIARVNGFAVGAGFGICLACDLRIASTEARFGTGYAKIAFCGDYGLTWMLTHLVGPAKAKEFLFLADVFDATDAERLGLVNRVVAHDAMEAEVRTFVARLAAGPLTAYRYMKENVNRASHTDFGTMLDREAECIYRCAETADHREGVRAFLEKRAAKFTGR